MKNGSTSPMLRFLQGAACTVIVLWGVSAASPVLGPLLLGLLFAYALVPFPRWLIRRFGFPKNAAIATTAAVVVAGALCLIFSLDLATERIKETLPVYEQRLATLHEQVAVSMSAHGVDTSVESVRNLLTPQRLREIAGDLLTVVRAIISIGLLILLLAFLFVTEMADVGVKRSVLAERLDYYGSGAGNYVAITARSAGINALVNLVFLFAMGVETPVVWSLLYFFLDFIPTLGFLIALVPPTFVTLLMFGWKRAVVVACGLILTNLIVDNVVTPIFMKQAVDVTFLEITLSLVGWAFLLGLIGAIVAIPLTLALKKFVAETLKSEQVTIQPSG
jgi:AI-2 transport protein TqsA